MVVLPSTSRYVYTALLTDSAGLNAVASCHTTCTVCIFMPNQSLPHLPMSLPLTPLCSHPTQPCQDSTLLCRLILVPFATLTLLPVSPVSGATTHPQPPWAWTHLPRLAACHECNLELSRLDLCMGSATPFTTPDIPCATRGLHLCITATMHKCICAKHVFETTSMITLHS